MVLPITTAVAREVYSQAPRDQIDAAYGLGGTKWGAIRTVVMPFGRSGLVGGAMLGLGRALGLGHRQTGQQSPSRVTSRGWSFGGD